MILYALSLLSSGFVMVIFHHAQPVLLYVFPIMVSGLILVAYMRKEVSDIWFGVNTINNGLTGVNGIDTNSNNIYDRSNTSINTANSINSNNLNNSNLPNNSQVLEFAI